VRTTLDLDEDVLAAVQERARREKRSAGAVLSDLARQALAGAASSDDLMESESFFGFVPLPHRGVVVTDELVERLREEGEDQ
jgi:hypothetical protein